MVPRPLQSAMWKVLGHQGNKHLTSELWISKLPNIQRELSGFCVFFEVTPSCNTGNQEHKLTSLALPCLSC